jgi:hypothetical protein
MYEVHFQPWNSPEVVRQECRSECVMTDTPINDCDQQAGSIWPETDADIGAK